MKIPWFIFGITLSPQVNLEIIEIQIEVRYELTIQKFYFFLSQFK